MTTTTNNWYLDNCTYSNGQLVWDNTSTDFGTPASPMVMYGYHAGIKANVGDTIELIAANHLLSIDKVHSGFRLMSTYNSFDLGGTNYGFNNSHNGHTNAFTILDVGESFSTIDLPVKYQMTYVSTTQIEQVVTSIDGTTELYRYTKTIPEIDGDVYFNFTLICEDESDVIPTSIAVL
ncbi:hypothetical protein GCM10025882_26840 [Acinetobacter gyllenbergii]|uniref:Uncharacterized protein n=1 Tax=Acinetobacter gyllenbergii CIP 110306 = MTCC 11365 TaxID=1217657 RepID=A0A829HB65_9GAMM|nr:hypothetical protein [Acinetobacter gyllenbergii]EPF70799.1 hypothetical protein F957_03933 [Acinetobacter gyllenbergii CIP 110306 = MTCC 11365]GMA12259.1 hypothetical protein GCM10025882_26840 [Acinetobacter gyllenbergii]